MIISIIIFPFFFVPIELPSSQPPSFVFSLPHLTREERMIGCVVLSHSNVEDTVLGLWIIDLNRLITGTRKVVFGTVEPF